MPHILYRPHIASPEKVITPDLIISSVWIKTENTSCEVPVDLVTFSINIALHTHTTLICKAIVFFSGQSEDYIAPAIILLDAALYKAEPKLAWQSARTVVSRRATHTQNGRVKTQNKTFEVSEKLPRASFLIKPAGQPHIPESSLISVDVTGTQVITADFSLTSLSEEG